MIKLEDGKRLASVGPGLWQLEYETGEIIRPLNRYEASFVNAAYLAGAVDAGARDRANVQRVMAERDQARQALAYARTWRGLLTLLRYLLTRR